ncbi:DNA polymerase beta domain protein region [Ferroglobus placidus DSM 10642]|uniref:DNA polymerase beta domain protein region n=1 Tax=Ferroglobus placidus (strain DSM 10642 / AEDII12DO) TaxID=589924 RepID=D3S0E5_FERPA|nr:nucleotidyltransferase domain-containing protein [Ferroglobus placidus]ADC66208.1 DNA polymerase beta domain protein region [Ferroglobus placidus DSM 10642]
MEPNPKISKIIETIKSHPNVIAIYLFGSHAKGETTPLSDIDIAVILENPTPESEADIGSLSSPEIDVVLFHRLPLHIKYEVFKYGKEIFVRDEEKLLEIKLKVMREYLDTVRMYKMISSEVLG